MKYLILFLLLTGCSNSFTVDQDEFRKAAYKYCEHCKSLNGAFINSNGLSILCNDGSQLNQQWNTVTKNVLIGTCK